MAETQTHQIKTWRIDNVDGLGIHELEWLKKNSGNVDWSPEEYDSATDVSGRTIYYKTKNARLKFTTMNSKQETLMQLKFGDKMILESFVNCYVAVSTCCV